MAELLAAQYPVLTWWGLLTVLTRIAATITVVAIYAVGAVLVSQRPDHASARSWPSSASPGC